MPHSVARSAHHDFFDPAAYAVMGYSLRTPGWRFTAWYRWNGGAPPRGEFAALAEELYAYDEVALSRGDLDATERVELLRLRACMPI